MEYVAPALNSVVVPGGVHFIDRGVVKLLVICPRLMRTVTGVLEYAIVLTPQESSASAVGALSCNQT